MYIGARPYFHEFPNFVQKPAFLQMTYSGQHVLLPHIAQIGLSAMLPYADIRTVTRFPARLSAATFCASPHAPLSRSAPDGPIPPDALPPLPAKQHIQHNAPKRLHDKTKQRFR